MAKPVNQAVFPGFARLADDRPRLRKSYLDSLALLILVTTPIGLGIGLLAEPIVLVFLGDKWLEAAPLVQALVVFGLLRTSTANANALYMALGHLRIEPALNVLFIVTMLPGIILGIGHWGIIGAAYVLTAGALLNLVINLFMASRLLQIGMGEVVGVVWRTGLAAFVMCLVVIGLPPPWSEPILQLVWSVPLGATTFIGVLLGSWVACGAPEGPESQLLAYLRDHLPLPGLARSESRAA